LNVTFKRKATITLHPFTDYFQGFEDVAAVQLLFGDATPEVLCRLRVEFYNGRSGMSFSDVDGHLRVNAIYLNHGDGMDLYLDTIHQLVHVKQFREGKPIYTNLIRVDRTLELEACHHTVDEARRLDLSDAQIVHYLRTEWMSEDDLRTLAKALHLYVDAPPPTDHRVDRRGERRSEILSDLATGFVGRPRHLGSTLNVTFKRKATITLHPFTDYFQGFEALDAVQQLFGERTELVLRTLKVGFSGRRGYMGVSDRDGHLTVSAEYLRNGDTVDIYLDIIHELTHVKQFLEGQELFDSHYRYVERPTEIEAFRNAITEARRLGLNEQRIRHYLRTEWMTDDDFARLTNTLNVPVR
jgi:hypothetical protein